MNPTLLLGRIKRFAGAPLRINVATHRQSSLIRGRRGAALLPTGLLRGQMIGSRGIAGRPMAGLHQLSGLSRLNLESSIVTFGISVGTAKKVLRELGSKAGGRARTVRGAGLASEAHYIPRDADQSLLDLKYGDFRGKVRPHTVVAPRETTAVQADRIAQARQSRVLPKLNADPVKAALREHGRSALPPDTGRRKTLKTKASYDLMRIMEPNPKLDVAERARKFLDRSTLRQERGAHLNVYRGIQAHGSPAEAAEWKTWANTHLNERRKTILKDRLHVSVSGALSGSTSKTLSQNKSFLRENPHLRLRSNSLGE